MSPPRRTADVQACADEIIDRLEGRVRLGLPVGLGKAVLLANALYRRARERPEVELHVYTALTLAIPRARSELEARLLEPIVERLYRGVPELELAVDHQRGDLPDNVRVTEFYFSPGAALGAEPAQRDYVSSNYSMAARDLSRHGVNVVAQMVAPGPGSSSNGDRPATYSMSCNPEMTRDLLDDVEERTGEIPMLVGEVNPRLPFFGDTAEMAAEEFDVLLEGDGIAYELFPVPNEPVSLDRHAIGLRIAGLVRDGGTLQIGIGGLGDAVAHALALRRNRNETFRALLEALGAAEPQLELDELPQGLYASSEMFAQGFLHLREQGVLTRTVDDGVFLHGGFYIGSARFYRSLRELPESERRGIRMTRISFTNQLLEDGERKRRQRVHARFVNSAMMVTLLGATVSDALEDGRVVSGVGGQYDFVAMAHELEGARSIIALPATRMSGGEVTSNIVWSYGHTTIPRHLRDLVVTEYGVADLRGASDAEVIASMLEIADSRFQDGLRDQAVAAGKLSQSHRIPERCRDNRPQALAASLEEPGLLDALPWFPLGTDLEDVEAELQVALTSLSDRQGSFPALAAEALSGWRRTGDPRLDPSFERMGLDDARGIRSKLYRALLASALLREVHDDPRPLETTTTTEETAP